MDAPRGFFSRFKTAVRKLVARLRPPPAMVGTPPSQRPMWHDPVAHARNFSKRYAEPLNYHHAPETELPIRHEARTGPEDQGWRASAQALIHSSRRCQPARVNRNTDSGPPTHVETGYMIRAVTSSR